MNSVLNYLEVKAFGRGMRGYNTAWFVVAGAVWMILRARRSEGVVYRTRIDPGDRLIISSGPPAPKS